MSASSTEGDLPVAPRGTGAQNLEVEVKLWLPDLDALRARILAGGGELIQPRYYERNVAFDTANRDLYQRGQLLRLRMDRAAIITFKGVPSHAPASEAKVREELETQVSDFDTTEAILTRLGFVRQRVYEKYRETFRWGEVEIMLDEMPYGNFVELEGDEAAIKATAHALKLDWSKRLLTNYLALMDLLTAHHQLPFEDVTFSNFDGLSISIADVLA